MSMSELEELENFSSHSCSERDAGTVRSALLPALQTGRRENVGKECCDMADFTDHHAVPLHGLHVQTAAEHVCLGIW